MLKNIDVKEACKRWCNCHTCFVKLPVVTAFIVVAALFLSGCSTQSVKKGWDVLINSETYEVILKPDGSIAYLSRIMEK